MSFITNNLLLVLRFSKGYSVGVGPGSEAPRAGARRAALGTRAHRDSDGRPRRPASTPRPGLAELGPCFTSDSRVAGKLIIPLIHSRTGRRNARERRCPDAGRGAGLVAAERVALGEWSRPCGPCSGGLIPAPGVQVLRVMALRHTDNVSSDTRPRRPGSPSPGGWDSAESAAPARPQVASQSLAEEKGVSFYTFKQARA